MQRMMHRQTDEVERELAARLVQARPMQASRAVAMVLPVRRWYNVVSAARLIVLI